MFGLSGCASTQPFSKAAAFSQQQNLELLHLHMLFTLQLLPNRSQQTISVEAGKAKICQHGGPQIRFLFRAVDRRNQPRRGVIIFARASLLRGMKGDQRPAPGYISGGSINQSQSRFQFGPPTRTHLGLVLTILGSSEWESEWEIPNWTEMRKSSRQEQVVWVEPRGGADVAR